MSTRDPQISNSTLDSTGRSARRAGYDPRPRAFRGLHERGCFVIPNPRDLGSARYLQHLGFPALATTNSGFAFSPGVPDSDIAVSEVRELARGLEGKFRRLLEANVAGIIVWNLEPLHKHAKTEPLHVEAVITFANDAFLSMVQYDREDLASGGLRWTDLTPAEWRGYDELALADLKATGIFQPFKKEYFRKDGSRVPVLLGGALFEASGNDGVAFVLDLSRV